MRKIAKIAAICAVFGLALFAAGCSNSSDPLPYVPGGGGRKIVNLSTVTTDYIVQDGFTVTGTLAADVKITLAPGAKVTLKDVVIEGTDNASYNWAGLTCGGNATIKLEGTNEIKGFLKYYPGVFVPKGNTLTIKGNGSLEASSNGMGAGIGGCYITDGISIEAGSCGKIVIEGGTITATGGSLSAGIGSGGCGCSCDGVDIKGGTVTAEGGANAAGIGCGGGSGPAPSGVGTSCGPISISGGTVTAIGGEYAAGVGTGNGANNNCGAITVTDGVTKFTATKGSGATNSVGLSRPGVGNMTCGAVTVGNQAYPDGISDDTFVYEPSPAPGPTPGTTLDLSKVTADTVVADGYTITGTLGANVKISIADDATVTLKDVTINGTNGASYKWAGLTCAGGATITLEGTNTVKGFKGEYPGIFVPKGKTLTIKGSGSLAANSNGYGAGIGGCYADGSAISKADGSCGTIVIEGGTITVTGVSATCIGCGYGSDCDGVTIKGGTVTATSSGFGAGIGSNDSSNGSAAYCGPISISGGTVTAKGGSGAAGIGSAMNGNCGAISISGGTVTATGGESAPGVGTGDGDSDCGAITVANTVTKFTASKGSGATDSVGRGDDVFGTCGAVTIGGTVYWDGSAYQNEGATVLTQNTYTYPQ